MAESTEILIGDQGEQHVLIRPLARRSPSLFEDVDSATIDCAVQLAVGGFRGELHVAVSSEGFQTFLGELEDVSGGMIAAAHVGAAAGQLALSLATDEEGRLRAAGEAIDMWGNRLQFGFPIDPASLPAICSALEAVLAAFPATDVAEQR